MASTSAQKASSSTSTPRSYDVFISFRGEDTRKNFTDHLYTTLVAYGVHTFRDDEELEKGGDIASDLLRAIEESKIFIIIFSTNYANSRWCLNELVKIFECTVQKQSTILPIFYHVNPSDVRKQSGSYGDAFVDHEKDADEKKMEVIQKWRTALNQVASLSGLHVDEQYETQVVKEITDDIIRRLNHKPLNVGKNIVGMDFHLEKLKSLMNIELNEVRVVGIYGIGGIGKTTIAKAVYNDISYQFDGSSFLNNVRERSKDNALQLQQELLHGILKGKSLKVSNMDEGIQMIKRSLSSKRVLVVFDDVDDLKQLENLAEEHSWFGPRSRIIITTRHKHFLTQYGVKESYEVQKLHDAEAIELFSWWAFQQNLPSEIYKNLSYRVVDYAKGLPLALKVLGSFLFKKTISEWESALCKLKTIPHMDIQNVLKISYDGLDDVEKGIFLDIACFFKGKDKDFVARILDEDFYAESGIGVLHDKCLISISENKLDMHDLLQQMGWEIVRQECPKQPGRRSRLWEHDDVYGILTRNLGTEEIEGIFLDMSRSEHIQFTTKAFKMMNRLRLLKIHQDATYNSVVKSWMVVDPSQAHLSETYITEDFEFPFYELRYLHWDGYALQSLPLNFHAKNLVELNLRFSNIRQLWKGKVLEKLKVINLSYSQDLIKFPDFSSVPNLEILILEGCISLESLPRGFYKLQCLQILSCRGCSKVKRFSEIKGNMRKLRELNLSGTAIMEVPPSIKHLNGLADLDLGNCKNLVSLPESICSLKSLKTLKLNDCSKLNSFLEIKGGDMGNLRELDLNSTAIEELSSTIEHLKALEYLSLAYCKSLVSLPDSLCNLTSLKILEVRGCSKLEKLPNDLGQLQCLEKLSLASISCALPCLSGLCSLRSLDLSKCSLTQGVVQSNNCLSSLEVLLMGNCKVMEVEILNLIFHLSSLEMLDLSNCNLMEGEIPSDIRHLSSLEELYLDGNHFSSIPTGINQLSRLVGLDLSHCKKLLQIPELPSSLRLLHAHSLPGTSSSPSFLPLHSLVNCFKSAIQDIECRSNSGEVNLGASNYLGEGICIVIPGSSGIPEWISMQEMGSEVTMVLPENWYQNNDFLGFALCCLYVPVDDEPEDESEHESVHTVENESGDEFQNESENESGDESELESGDGFETELFPSACRFECALTIHGDQSKYVDHLSFYSDCECHVDDNDGVSDQVWVICYPKVAIDQRYRSDQWTHFMASFKGFYNFGERTFKVKKCGIHLIYAQNFQ
ncbi:hypothetical protein PVL29_002497 [Vitis rotundifolia]|uniref:ADP-ribosyl cyclase/cyclic ADP-ribose hydrolase n=1 Tax=Vitis rotundifolia TaxID=103349 RepID=A0AA39AHU6_VITRO|nr:hypothetical protein PVL29_002497 [Vitis rotundifolia]